MYVKAFRWATDRVADEGVVAFVSNNGFLDGIAFDGMRKHLGQGFSTIYHLNLKGNARTSGERRRREGGNIFEDAIRVGVGVTLLVKNRNRNGRLCKIYVCSVDDYLGYDAKREFIEAHTDIRLLNWDSVVPGLQDVWLTAGLREDFASLLALEPVENGDTAIFRVLSNGAKTNRDAWAYSFGIGDLQQNITNTIADYNENVDRWSRHDGPDSKIDDFVTSDESKISWSETLKKCVEAGEYLQFDSSAMVSALYRPYVRTNIYFDPVLNERRYQLPRIFPKHIPPVSNQAICVTAPGSTGSFRALMTDIVPDIHLTGDSRCFPFYTYAEDGTNRRENITDWALEQFRSHYHAPSITKWDIFHYVYAVLHHPEYRERYAANLRRELPRIPFASAANLNNNCHPERSEGSAVPRPPEKLQIPRSARDDKPKKDSANPPSSTVKDVDVFRELAKAGQRLAEIHVYYEQQPEYPLTKREKAGEKLNWRVTKMRLGKDKTTLTYNDFLTLSDIPKETYDYRLGNRSALEWVIDQYQASTDKRSGITNDPNREDDPQYILRLIGQVITVSLETVKIVKELPALQMLTSTGGNLAS